MGLACSDSVGATEFARLGHAVSYLQTGDWLVLLQDLVKVTPDGSLDFGQ